MPLGFDTPKYGGEGGSSDFFDLEEGDVAELVLQAEPFIVPVHKIPDPATTWGKMILCGAPDRNACPICEDQTGKYDMKSKAVTDKIFLPVFISRVIRKTSGQPETVNAARVLSGGARMREGFDAFYGAMKGFGGTVFGTPILVTKMGEGTKVAFNVQRHPDPTAVVTVTADPVDVSAIGMRMLEKGWEGLGYDPLAKPAPTPASAFAKAPVVPKASALVEDHDPFANLPSPV